ncbi:MAG: carboxypeptidase regulatory-like domain-containing protein [candidate division Zixibacteria bacterium]|nr:carboxypeptidase regulatory-like domain-containing protein [candidate division Zixibacteria bacterium]
MTRISRLARIFAAVVCLVALASTPSGAAKPDRRSFGVIAGRVMDSIGTPLAGASVLLAGPDHRTKTDDSGQFALRDLKPGRYAVRFSHVGYETKSVDHVIVAGDSTTHLRLVMTAVAVRGRDIIVEGATRVPVATPVVGAVNLTREELRRMAGFSEDVIRSVNSLPGITRTGDVLSAMSVRGGSPSENAFYIDGIPLPDINHLPMHGSSGGAVGLINAELIDDVRLSLGGFDAAFGGKLSSVMELRLREGDRARFHGRIDASQAGLGGIIEGPLTPRGSFIVSARHGMLDVLLRQTDAGVGPQCNDYQGKLVFDLSAKHRLFALGIAGADRLDISPSEGRKFGSSVYGKWRSTPFTFGAGWDAKWSERLESHTTFSQSVTEYRYETQTYSWRQTRYEDHSRERSWTLRGAFDWLFNSHSRLKFGLEVVHQSDDENFNLPWYIDPFQHYVPELRQDERIEGSSLGAFITHVAHISDHVSTTAGCRVDYSTLTHNLHLSPRLSGSWRAGRATTADFAGGVVYQTLPMALLAQNPAHRSLADPVSFQLVASLRQGLTTGLEAGLAVYSKWYDRMPIDRAVPQLYVLDEVLATNQFWFQHHEYLAATGRATSRGIEMIIRGRTERNVDGMLGVSYSRNRYRDGKGEWHDRVLDTRLSAIADGGWNFTPTWRLGFRWMTIGGAAFTPFDLRRSRQLRVGIYDSTSINSSRLPWYHSLNLRLDKKIHFGGTTLGAYVVVWNALNKRPINSFYWYEAGYGIGWGTWLGRVYFAGLEYRL